MWKFHGITCWRDPPTTAEGDRVGAHQTFTCGLVLVLDIDRESAAPWWREASPCTGVGWYEPALTEQMDATTYRHPTQGEITHGWRGPVWEYQGEQYDSWEKAVEAAANWKEPNRTNQNLKTLRWALIFPVGLLLLAIGAAIYLGKF